VLGRSLVVAAIVVTALWFWTGVATAVAPAVPPLSQDVAANQEPGIESAEAQGAAQIEDFRAMPARKRGRIELKWHYEGRPIAGAFVVERSTNGSSWRSVAACNIGFDEGTADYGCTDSGLRSGTTYAYRACIVARGTACTAATATRTVSVKAP
jgi:hypothetical protein